VYAESIRNGDGTTLSQDSNPRVTVPGTIVRNASAIDHTTRTLNVEADVENKDGKLLPGTLVFVHLHLPAGANTVTIPSNTLLFRSEGPTSLAPPRHRCGGTADGCGQRADRH
jgi:Membrane-fusion protein